MPKKQLESIVINKTFKDLDHCIVCKGVVFHFEEQVLQLGGMSDEQRKEMRRLAIGVGYIFEALQDHFGEPDFAVEEWESWTCEKCGREDDAPKKGGA